MNENQKYKLYHGAWVNMVAPHTTKYISPDDAKTLLNQGGLMVRNTYNWDKQEETSFWFVIKDVYGGIDELPSKARNQVRKSQKTYDFRKVDAEEMIEKGLELYNLSRERFGNKDLYVDKNQFIKNYCGGGRNSG